MKFLALTVTLLGVLASPVRAENLWLFNGSQAVLIGSELVDAGSSWGSGGVETNPILGRGPFGARQLGIKTGITLGLVVAERVAVRRHPWLRVPFTVANIVGSAVLVQAAVQNERLP